MSASDYVIGFVFGMCAAHFSGYLGENHENHENHENLEKLEECSTGLQKFLHRRIKVPVDDVCTKLLRNSD